jgi:hypothetical protein
LPNIFSFACQWQSRDKVDNGTEMGSGFVVQTPIGIIKHFKHSSNGFLALETDQEQTDSQANLLIP